MSRADDPQSSQPPSFVRRTLTYLGLNRSIFGLLSMVILVGMGEKMAERFLPLYLMALGGGAISIGLLNGLDNLMSSLYSLPGGYLADRLGVKRSLLVFNVMALAGFAIVIAFPIWQAAIVGAILFLSWTAISLPATISLIAQVLPRTKRTMGVSVHSLVRRIPMALGPIVGGLFIGAWGERDGVRLAFVFAFAMGIVAMVLQQRLIREDETDDDAAVNLRLHELLTSISPSLRRLLVADILVRFCEQIPYAFVVVWCVKVISAPVTAFQFGLLTAIEMATAMLVYIPVAHLADRSAKKPFVVITFGFFTLFPLVLLHSQSFPLLVVAFIVRGLKEFGEPTRKALIMDLAPEDRKATAFGFYYLIRDSIVSLAAFGGAFLWMHGPATNFLVATGFGLMGTLWYAIFGRDLGRPDERAGASQP
ncbi:MAG: MFS transporter [Armatimonadetes bacterium]|nr:MFS transporter [Armatimonadota bacterium]